LRCLNLHSHWRPVSLRRLAERNSEGISCHHFGNLKLICQVPGRIMKN